MAFMDDYEGNKDRTNRWIKTFPEGRLECQIIEFNEEKGYVLVQAKAWRNQSEIHPAGVDYAYGYLSAYPDKMKRWMIEDTCTSALMRVMALVIGGTDKATKEVMNSIENYDSVVHPYKRSPNENSESQQIADDDLWNSIPSYKTAAEAEFAGIPSFGSSFNPVAATPDAAPQCRHGSRVWRTGTAAKTGKDWANYSCTGRKPDQCDPIWYVFASDGTWKVQV